MVDEYINRRQWSILHGIIVKRGILYFSSNFRDTRPQTIVNDVTARRIYVLRK